MFRNIVFQVHWLLGITCGLVLALMGVTGAALSFENELLAALNAGRMSVTVRDVPVLEPPELLERIARQDPGRRVGTLSVSAEPGRAARVGFLPARPPDSDVPARAPAAASNDRVIPDPASSAASKDRVIPANAGILPPSPSRARLRMDIEFADPYDGRLLAAEKDLRGHATLDFAENLHRRLAAGDAGRLVTGVSAIALVFFAASGLYLRWPRRALDWRTWLVPRWRQRGRPFLISLHSVAGTWVLPVYLVSALSGLNFAFDWYRDGAQKLLGVQAAPRVQQPFPRGADPLPDLRTAWAGFLRETSATGWSTASFNVPSDPGQPLMLNYLVANPPHERASNRIALDVATGALQAHERYADRKAGERLAASFFPLHRGSYWGVGGVLVVMVASLAMPVFAVTGWMQYLKRRRAQRAPSAIPAGDPAT